MSQCHSFGNSNQNQKHKYLECLDLFKMVVGYALETEYLVTATCILGVWNFGFALLP
jgi:hypothetical protein